MNNKALNKYKEGLHKYSLDALVDGLNEHIELIKNTKEQLTTLQNEQKALRETLSKRIDNVSSTHLRPTERSEVVVSSKETNKTPGGGGTHWEGEIPF